jgi:hypothetical protein
MKWAVILALALEATAQLSKGLGKGVGGKGWARIGSVKRTPKWRSTAQRITLQYGPLKLLAVNVSGPETP